MIARRLARAGAALVAAGALLLGSTLPAQATHDHKLGHRSLAKVLAKDGGGFDRNWNDYDIVDNAVRAVLTAKPASQVGVLAKGKVALTAFLPTDRAFRRLVRDLTGTRYRTEAQVFAAVALLGIDTIETVLLYHVVPGATITYKQALRANGAELTTAQGGTITVRVVYGSFVRLRDADPDDRNPWVVQPNINKGNKQIAHGINEVLRPLNL